MTFDDEFTRDGSINPGKWDGGAGGTADWHSHGLYWRDDRSGPYASMQFYLNGSPSWSLYTLRSGSTNLANGIYMFLSLDNDQTGGGATNAFLVQYARVWRLEQGGRSSSPGAGSRGGAAAK